ncbi:MAG: hypothetical protein EXR51_08980 [Dehalococcoidia bacterium]|nr:hypothetical protein [Dehalococcoidia bacterium]
MSLLAQYAPFRPLVFSGSAFTPDSRSAFEAALAAEDSMEQSFALFGSKAAAISEVWALVEECAEPNWDGAGAKPLSPFAAEQAAALVRALPDGVPLPEFAPEPEGSISLDWIRASNRPFSLSASISSRLPYAWLDGDDRGHAVARFDGETIPPRILEGIRRIMSDGTAAVRAA